MKRKKLAKKALDNPELFSPAELSYFEMWLREKKAQKERPPEKFTNCDDTLSC